MNYHGSYVLTMCKYELSGLSFVLQYVRRFVEYVLRNCTTMSDMGDVGGGWSAHWQKVSREGFETLFVKVRREPMSGVYNKTRQRPLSYIEK